MDRRRIQRITDDAVDGVDRLLEDAALDRDVRAGAGRCGAGAAVADVVAGFSQVEGVQDDAGRGRVVVESVALDHLESGLVVGLLDDGSEDDLGRGAARVVLGAAGQGDAGRIHAAAEQLAVEIAGDQLV